MDSCRNNLLSYWTSSSWYRMHYHWHLLMKKRMIRIIYELDGILADDGGASSNTRLPSLVFELIFRDITPFIESDLRNRMGMKDEET